MLQRPEKPSFCIIAPTAFLEPHAARSHTHLVLAHIVAQDPVYADFYLKMKRRGDRVILDNGAFELGESYSPEKLMELGYRCGADTLVLPDYPGQLSHLTIDAANKWAPRFKSERFNTMFVPQGKVGDLEAWISSYQWGCDNPNIDMIGMSILNIPNALPHIPPAYARVVMVQLLKERKILSTTKYHHFLGLNAGPNIELPALIRMEVLDSCDSSNPVWCGVNGIRYDFKAFDCMTYKKSQLPSVRFDAIRPNGYIFSKTVDDNITHNLDVVFDMFESPDMYI